jgi:hypothetical protein
MRAKKLERPFVGDERRSGDAHTSGSRLRDFLFRQRY